jgi:hypothetical protein
VIAVPALFLDLDEPRNCQLRKIAARGLCRARQSVAMRARPSISASNIAAQAGSPTMEAVQRTAHECRLTYKKGTNGTRSRRFSFDTSSGTKVLK